MSGERDLDQPFQSHPGEAEASQTLPRHTRRLDQTSRRIEARKLESASPHTRDVRGALSQAIRSIVLPRLVAARNAQDMTLATYGRSITEQDIVTLLSHVTTADQNLSEAMLTVLRLRGVSREDVLLDLFQPVAQRLGERWLSDACTFADVTLGTGRLQRLMRSDAMPRAPHRQGDHVYRILIATMPGEQHTFGAAVVEDLFRSAGWDTMQWTGDNSSMLDAVATATPCDVIGISICEQTLLAKMAPLAQRLRTITQSRGTMLIAGGHAFAAQSLPPSSYGVDAIVRNPRLAVKSATALLNA